MWAVNWLGNRSNLPAERKQHEVKLVQHLLDSCIISYANLAKYYEKLYAGSCFATLCLCYQRTSRTWQGISAQLSCDWY